jgi:pimeloyl-ACP methyl ester carboxylesterase
MVLEEIIKRHPGPWVVFGSSFGGPIAAVLAARNPDRVSSVLLTSPALAPGKEKTYAISHTIKLPAFGWMFPRIFRVANAEKLSHESQLRSIEHYYGKIVQPVTYIYGAQDELIYTENAAYARDRFSQAKMKQICLNERPHFFTFTEQGLITHELVALLDYARPPKSRLEEARREEAGDSAHMGRRFPFRPLPRRIKN